jgi:hypothetical protein
MAFAKSTGPSPDGDGVVVDLRQQHESISVLAHGVALPLSYSTYGDSACVRVASSRWAVMPPSAPAAVAIKAREAINIVRSTERSARGATYRSAGLRWIDLPLIVGPF